jgi:uncharacterized NAD-dependent epimerase/dehydratase family protein
MKKKIIVATDGLLKLDYAKTAHGLIRGSERFEVLAVIDAKHSGLDAGEILDGKNRDIPVMSSVQEAIDTFKYIDYLFIGVATVGGVLSDSLLITIRKAISNRIGIVNGLHEQLDEQEDIVELAQEHNVELIDIRKPKPIKDLHFWTGDIYKVDVPIIAFLAMDCAMGKRTTARLIVEKCSEIGIQAEMIYSGQTGWMQGGKYGFILDSTINDFVSGELENAIITCWQERKPDLILLEGQSSLRNPSGPCGLELLISGNAKQVILVHSPHRKYFDDDPSWGEIPSVESEIEIIEKFGSTVIALALNTNGLSQKEALNYKTKYKESLCIPVVMPLEEGVTNLISAIKGLNYEN